MPPQISPAAPPSSPPGSPRYGKLAITATNSPSFPALETRHGRALGPPADVAPRVSTLAPVLGHIAPDAVQSLELATTSTVPPQLCFSPTALVSRVPEVLVSSPVASTEVLEEGSTSSLDNQRKRKQKKQGNDSGCKRVCAVGADALVAMVESYSAHFAKYCVGRKKVVQKVPARVWKQVYQDYIDDKKEQARAAGMVFDLGKLPQERTLQDALRGALQGIETGVADCSLKGIDEATPQNVDLLTKLKQTDTFYRRKMSGFRES
ncbi:hypothetical protein BWQ96_06476 [Gracilariopsis chorda]|uniref:Uncharacterized protein n=1 Tax=Gracilariopsis chorda TaxID=448386 RepID=A0A2V3INV2_9FLOR|nr:hypothetical protein BWQ96_06476 [Gracilariopsis chorda]|eukprot:PXF43744.1 hypothetical protein BWQ96_06476 [Gracilariopsis chorda]